MCAGQIREPKLREKSDRALESHLLGPGGWGVDAREFRS